MTATNTSGVTSVPSELFTGIPTLVLGVRAPGLVQDLMLDRAGDDALLSWGAVTLDIYGGAVSIGQYEIFRGELAVFVPATENRIGTTAATNVWIQESVQRYYEADWPIFPDNPIVPRNSKVEVPELPGFGMQVKPDIWKHPEAVIRTST